MDDSDLVFVPSVSHSSDGEGADEVYEDFEDLKEAVEVKPEEFQVIVHGPKNDYLQAYHLCSLIRDLLLLNLT